MGRGWGGSGKGVRVATAPPQSPANVPTGVPGFGAGRWLEGVKERVLQSLGQGEAFDRLVFQHPFNEVKQVVVLFRLGRQVPLWREDGRCKAASYTGMS